MNSSNHNRHRHFRALLFLSLLSLPLIHTRAEAQAAPAAEGAQTAYSVAVLDFEAKNDQEKELSAKVTPLVVAQLSAQPEFMLIERAEIDKLLGEQALGLSGTVTPDTAAKIGQLTGAQVLITGRAFTVDNQLVLVAKILSTETSRVYGEMVSASPNESVMQLSTQLVEKISETVRNKGNTLVAHVPPVEDRAAKLAKLLEGKQKPVVSVAVTEVSFGSSVPDPAVQTELALLLQKLGFEVIDSKTSPKSPDVIITGEAFSELALRKGNLVSAKGRIELKAVDAKTGKILSLARRTDVAVDLAENIAGKSALEKATNAAAEEFIPKLVQ